MTLIRAFDRFRHGFNNVNFLSDEKDEFGTYAIRFSNAETNKQAFFVFKNSMKGKWLSVHYSLYQEAKEHQMPIVLGLGEKYFYMFTADEIDKECRTNERDNGVLMMNFPITAGRSLQKKKRDAEPAPKRTPKNKKKLPDDGLFETPIGKVLERELGPLERVG